MERSALVIDFDTYIEVDLKTDPPLVYQDDTLSRKEKESLDRPSTCSDKSFKIEIDLKKGEPITNAVDRCLVTYCLPYDTRKVLFDAAYQPIFLHRQCMVHDSQQRIWICRDSDTDIRSWPSKYHLLIHLRESTYIILEKQFELWDSIGNVFRGHFQAFTNLKLGHHHERALTTENKQDELQKCHEKDIELLKQSFLHDLEQTTLHARSLFSTFIDDMYAKWKAQRKEKQSLLDAMDRTSPNMKAETFGKDGKLNCPDVSEMEEPSPLEENLGLGALIASTRRSSLSSSSSEYSVVDQFTQSHFDTSPSHGHVFTRIKESMTGLFRTRKHGTLLSQSFLKTSKPSPSTSFHSVPLSSSPSMLNSLTAPFMRHPSSILLTGSPSMDKHSSTKVKHVQSFSHIVHDHTTMQTFCPHLTKGIQMNNHLVHAHCIASLNAVFRFGLTQKHDEYFFHLCMDDEPFTHGIHGNEHLQTIRGTKDDQVHHNVTLLSYVSAAQRLYSHDLSGFVLFVDAETVRQYYSPQGWLNLSSELVQGSKKRHSISVHVLDWLLAVNQRCELHGLGNWWKQIKKAMKFPHGNLSPGDVLITRHSALSRAHIVFHVITNVPHNRASLPSESNSSPTVSRNAMETWLDVGMKRVFISVAKWEIRHLTIVFRPYLVDEKANDQQFLNRKVEAERIFVAVRQNLKYVSRQTQEDARTVEFLLSTDVTRIPHTHCQPSGQGTESTYPCPVDMYRSLFEQFIQEG